PVDLKLTHLDWNPEATLIHFQGQYLTTCELDYNILQGVIQNAPKAPASVDVGEFCLVEDLTSARWYRGRVQSLKKDLYDVFLIDHGNVLSVDEAHISCCSNDLFILPPKIVCGFLSSVLLLSDCCHSVLEQYFANLVGRNVTGYIKALLPHKVLLMEAPDINSDLVHYGFGRHVDTDTFLLLVEMLTEAPLKQNIEPAPDLLIEKQRRQEFFLKPSSLRGYEDILSSFRPKLKCGSHAIVHVTAAVNPGLFYCQMTAKESELKELSSKLAAAVNQLRTSDNPGLLCSVKGKDENWYRGLVQHLPVNSLVRVLFVDYGYFETVRVENIHKLPPDLCSIPIKSFPCALSCMNNEEEAIKSKQLGFLKTSLLGGILEIEINKYKPEQHLYCITILNAKERVTPTPIQKSPSTKLTRSEQSLPQIMSKELDKTLEDEEIQVGSVFTGYVEHVQNPNHFWVRSEKRNNDFEEMMEKLFRHFRRIALDEDVLENPEPGMLCCAVYEEDLHYYRGVVVDLLENGAEVLFIDFGNTGKVPHNLIKKIPKEFADKSAFALCCSLVNVVPTDELWPSSSIDSFRRLVSNKVLQVCVIQIRKNKFDVDLYFNEESGNGGGQSLSEILISAQQAHYGKNISEQFTGKKKKHTYYKQKVTKHNRQPLVNPKASENCNKEKEASKYELEKTKEPVSLKGLNIKPGCEFAVRCILINTPSDFWCQLLDQVPALESLMERLQGHYSIKTVPLEPEPCCVVKSPSNGKWCRGIITERQNGRANVILVDFGSSIQVSEECLQGLLPEFCVFEKQAFRCSLYNVIEPLALGWTKDATEFLRRFADNSGVNLKCNVVSQLNVKNKGLCNVVDLCNTESNQSVSNLLVEKCLARVVTRTLSPTVFPESFVYSSYGLTERSEEKVFVTHVHSHFEIFCQLEKNTAVFEEIDDKISEVLKLKQTNAETVVEKLCLAKYLDGQWYRGIAYLAQSPSHVFVTFVDYGNTMIAEKKNVVFIPKESTELLNKPMQALRFCLAGVPQGLVFADVKEWLDTAVLNKQVRAIIVAKEEDGSFEVELFDGEVSINDRLKKLIDTLTPKPKIAMTLNIKSERKNMNQNVSKSQLKAKTPMSNRHRQKKNQKSNKRSQNRQTEPVKSQQSKKAEVKQTAVTQDCPSPPEPQSNYAIQDNKKLGQKSKRECFVVLQISCLPVIKLTEGLKLACFASHIDSLSSFFLQRSSDEANIFQMAEDINSSFFKETLEPCTNIALKADDLVIVEYKDDGALYRAVVKENIDSCTFKVEFVDFGNSDIVGNEKMFVMTKDNVSQPRYSIPCSLLDCSAFDDTAAFTDVVMDKPFMVEFVCFRKSQWQVKVEILDATISVPVEAAAPKETDTVPEVKKTTQTKPNITKRVMRERKKKLPKKISIVKVSKDLFSAFLPPKIQKGDTETGLVLSVQSNGDFYLRLDKSEDSLAALETLLAAHLKYCEPVLTNNVKEGLNCLVQEQNGRKWRRAAVKDVFHDACLLVFVEVSEKYLWFVEMVRDRFLLQHHVSNTETKTELDSARENESATDPQKLVFAPVELNKEYCGFAAAVTTPFEFCVVLEDLYLMSQVSVLLDDFRDELQPLPLAHLVPKTGCLVKSKSRNKWCRAEILHVDSTLTLDLVDYGHAECLSYGDHSKLKKLPDCIKALPKVTYPCVLNTVRPAEAEEQWSDEAIIFFQQCLDQRNLQIFFREEISDCQWKVDILANGVHVAKQLVDAGYGSYMDIMLGLR
ncbi:hypothetical protein NQD34_017795, partial [Periophthalmus magnuspinnatus]